MDEKIEVERRKEHRLSVELIGRMEVGGEFWDCYIQNISSGGAFVLSNLPSKLNDKLILHFEFQGNSFIQDAEVVNVKELETHRKRIFQIAKNLELQYCANLKFRERISLENYALLQGSLS